MGSVTVGRVSVKADGRRCVGVVIVLPVCTRRRLGYLELCLACQDAVPLQYCFLFAQKHGPDVCFG